MLNSTGPCLRTCTYGEKSASRTPDSKHRFTRKRNDVCPLLSGLGVDLDQNPPWFPTHLTASLSYSRSLDAGSRSISCPHLTCRRSCCQELYCIYPSSLKSTLLLGRQGRGQTGERAVEALQPVRSNCAGRASLHTMRIRLQLLASPSTSPTDHALPGRSIASSVPTLSDLTSRLSPFCQSLSAPDR